MRGVGLQDDRARGRGRASSTKGLGRIDKFLAGGVEKGKVTAEEKDKTLGNLSGTTKLEDLKDCDLIIEAIIENVEEKAKAYASSTASSASTRSSARTPRRSASPSWPRRRSGRIGSPGCTSSIPVPLMKLVEVIRGLTTSDETYQTGLRLRAVARQGADHRARQARLHRQPPAGAVPARRDPLATSTGSARSRTSTRA